MEKIYIGFVIDYWLVGEEFFREGYIEDIRVEDSLIVFGDWYVNVYDIVELCFVRGWGKVVGILFMIFGGFWLGFVFLGYVIDGNFEISYSGRDVVVIVIFVGLGYVFVKLVWYRKVCIGRCYCLCLLDLCFSVDLCV